MTETITGRILEQVAYYFPGRNAYRDGIEDLLPHLDDIPFTKAVSEVKDVIGAEWNKPWVKPVVLLGVTVGLAATFSWYLRSRPGANTGLSMGEKGALISAGFLDVGQGLTTIKTRGQRLAELSNPDARLAAVVGMPIEEIESRVGLATQAGIPMDLANKNTPEQGVVGLLIEHLDAARQIFKGARVVVLDGITEAVHTRFVEPASERFKMDLPGLVRIDDLREPVGKVFSAMRAARNLDPLVQTAHDAYDVIWNQIRSPLDQPVAIRALLQSGVQDIIVFDPTGASARLVKACVGEVANVIAVKNREDMVAGISTIATKYNVTDIRDPQKLIV